MYPVPLVSSAEIRSSILALPPPTCWRPAPSPQQRGAAAHPHGNGLAVPASAGGQRFKQPAPKEILDGARTAIIHHRPTTSSCCLWIHRGPWKIQFVVHKAGPKRLQASNLARSQQHL